MRLRSFIMLPKDNHLNKERKKLTKKKYYIYHVISKSLVM